MNERDFALLVESIQQAGEIKRGEHQVALRNSEAVKQALAGGDVDLEETTPEAYPINQR